MKAIMLVFILSAFVGVNTKKCPKEEQVQCLVNPCQGWVCKEPEGLTCRANYCGGCKQEWFKRPTSEVPVPCDIKEPQ